MAVKKEEAKAEMSLEDVQKQIAEMLANAKAEAQAIVDEAKKAAGEVKEQQDQASADREAELSRGEELVEVKLFKDNDKYKDPVFVGCNGETVAIERGVRVKIKRKFAEILDNSEHQDYETAQLIERKSDEFSKTGL